jgi:diphthamide biosynthesis protein 3
MIASNSTQIVLMPQRMRLTLHNPDRAIRIAASLLSHRCVRIELLDLSMNLPTSLSLHSPSQSSPPSENLLTMADENIYDEIEIEDMTYDETMQTYYYPCPCGDRFEINIEDLRDGEEIAVCPSCSLQIRVIFDVDDLPKPEGGAGTQQIQPKEVVAAT